MPTKLMSQKPTRRATEQRLPQPTLAICAHRRIWIVARLAWRRATIAWGASAAGSVPGSAVCGRAITTLRRHGRVAARVVLVAGLAALRVLVVLVAVLRLWGWVVAAVLGLVVVLAGLLVWALRLWGIVSWGGLIRGARGYVREDKESARLGEVVRRRSHSSYLILRTQAEEEGRLGRTRRVRKGLT
jgi:hypothetical protein